MQDRECARRLRAADDRGIALLVTLAVVAILAVVVLDFGFSVRVDMRIAANFRDRVVALEAAKAGVNSGIYKLRQDTAGRDNLQDDWAKPWGIVLDITDPAEIEDQSTLTEEEIGVERQEDFLACQEGGNIPTASIVVCDEERKINVNLLSDVAGARGGRPVSPENRLRAREWMRTLLENLEFPDVDPYELADNITDWVDSDDDGDAEYLHYESLPEPYSCRNDLMESIYELKLVKGVTDLVFFGNKPYPMQLSGLEEDEWDEKEQLGYTMPDVPPWEREEDPYAMYGLVNFLTAHSSGRINPNTAPPEVVRAILSNDDFLTETIIEARTESPLDPREFQDMVLPVSQGLYRSISGLITFGSTYFRIESTGKFHKAAVKVIAIVSRDNSGGITLYYWREEDVRPGSSSEDPAMFNVM